MNIFRYSLIIFTIIIFIVISSFLAYGLTDKINLSPDYNIPLAKNIISVNFLNINSNNPFMYFPASSHFILAFFLLIGFPNLFGLFSFIVLLFVCKKLGDVFGLKNHMSYIFSFGFCTSISIIRTVGDQSIDKWLCTWFIASIIILEKLKPNWRFSILLGITLGLLIGTKYSGPLFFIALLPIYGVKILKFLNIPRTFLTFFVFFITGLFWYVRNFILQNNFYYPANILFFKGVPGYTQQDWYLWKIPFEYPAGIKPLLDSFYSEYAIWSFSILFIILFLFHIYKNKIQLEYKMKKVFAIVASTGIVSLFLPITPAYEIELFHIISDMRYIYILIVFSVLALFMIAEKYKLNALITILSLINSLYVFSFLPYQPKLFTFWIVLGVIIYLKNPNFTLKIFKKFYKL